MLGFSLSHVGIRGEREATRLAFFPNVKSPDEHHVPDSVLESLGAALSAPIAFPELEEYTHLSSEGADPDGTHSHLVTDPGSPEGHGGSHPHLVHEFISALSEDRDPFPNAVQSANITCTGILSHESALKGGELIPLPDFTLSG